jgi:hypothetical protein
MEHLKEHEEEKEIAGLTGKDRELIGSMGITEQQIKEQVRTFRRGQAPVQLLKAATVGDGIVRFSKKEEEQMIALFNRQAGRLKTVKFVPASGAATRMFQTLLYFNNHFQRLHRDDIKEKAGSEGGDYGFLNRFAEGIENRSFAFIADLEQALAASGQQLNALVEQGEYKPIIDHLLSEKGLNYANLPKALLKFHKYGEYSRTALEEHLVEGKTYCRGQGGDIYLHLTVTPQHKSKIDELLDKAIPRCRDKGDRFHIEFSEQNPATNTVAVDESNHLFRDLQGNLATRPAGHGALIENLNGLEGDVIFIKNIDNVVPDRLKEETTRYKKILAGFLLHIREQVFGRLEQLSTGNVTEQQLEKIFHHCRREFNLDLPAKYNGNIGKVGMVEKKKLLWDMLNRPIRVCGMVKNEGEPGGGPYWVKEKDGRASLQIVESAQIDKTNPGCREIMDKATHFNPVDLVCGIRDFKGNAIDLKKFVDPDTYFISKKSLAGKTLKALELPGLWNGAMARWITLFVEVPISTFNPIKTVNDLLRAQHQ